MHLVCAVTVLLSYVPKSVTVLSVTVVKFSLEIGYVKLVHCGEIFIRSGINATRR